MIALETILLPTDGSECSRKALTYALSFAQRFGARIVALHVVERRWEEQSQRASGELRPEVIRKAQERHAEEVRQILAEVGNVGAKVGVAVETKVMNGAPVEQIVRMAQGFPVDLIIMGTHGRTGISHVFLGSVAERVVRYAPCPVLTVRLKGHEFISP
jgi:nucleotide-binding universal stress UspA family protein